MNVPRLDAPELRNRHVGDGPVGDGPAPVRVPLRLLPPRAAPALLPPQEGVLPPRREPVARPADVPGVARGELPHAGAPPLVAIGRAREVLQAVVHGDELQRGVDELVGDEGVTPMAGQVVF